MAPPYRSPADWSYATRAFNLADSRRGIFLGEPLPHHVLLGLVLLLILLVAVGAGLVGSLAGLGGGVVLVPVLVILFGVPFPYAVGASLIAVLATSITTGSTYLQERLANLRIGMFLEIATVPGALLGATLILVLVNHNLEPALLVAFGALLLLSIPGSLTLRSEELPQGVEPDGWSRKLHLEGSYHDERLGREVHYRAGRTPLTLGLMAGAGVVSALFGIGGGVVKVVALEKEMRLPMKVSTATSNFMIGVTVAAGASILLLAGYVNPVLAAPVAVGTAIGAYFGSLLLPRLTNRQVRWIFIPILAILAIELILQGVGLP